VFLTRKKKTVFTWPLCGAVVSGSGRLAIHAPQQGPDSGQLEWGCVKHGGEYLNFFSVWHPRTVVKVRVVQSGGGPNQLVLPLKGRLRGKTWDWMRQMEAKVTALQKTVRQLCTEITLNSASAASCLQDLKEMKFQSMLALEFAKKKLRTDLQANINETADTIQISETKTNTSISELRETFDVQTKLVAESTDKKIKDSVGEVRSETVRSLVNQVKKIEEI